MTVINLYVSNTNRRTKTISKMKDSWFTSNSLITLNLYLNIFLFSTIPFGVATMLESQLIESPEGFRQDEHQSLGVLVLQPKGALQMEDFLKLAEKVDHYLLNHERLHSVVIHSKDFPGWTNFSALLSHLRFVRQHH